MWQDQFMFDPEFQAQLERRIATYRSMRAGIQEKLVDLNHELTSVGGRLEAAERLYREEFKAEPPGGTGTKRFRGSRSRLERPWRPAIAQVLSDAREPLHVKEIWRRLADSGFETNSVDPVRSIVSIAVRDPEIHKVAPNTYALAPALETAQLALQSDGARRQTVRLIEEEQR